MRHTGHQCNCLLHCEEVNTAVVMIKETLATSHKLMQHMPWNKNYATTKKAIKVYNRSLPSAQIPTLGECILVAHHN
jgi:hypothetical protein